jgi:hypothetical protein
MAITAAAPAQAAARVAAQIAATAGAQYCMLRKDPLLKRFTGDVRSPLMAGALPSSTQTALADDIGGATELGVLAGPRPTSGA